MASLKRSKTMPADGHTARFLYTILKQLDLKSIDWNLVASQLEISNGHAARMRFSRFRQHMEGITTTHRTPRPKKHKYEKTQLRKEQQFSKPKLESTLKTEQAVKQELGPEQDMDVQPAHAKVLPMDIIPTSSLSEQLPYSVTTVAPADLALPFAASNPPIGFHSPPSVVSDWSRIKTEKREEATHTLLNGFVKWE
ncbi:hypothetical protein ACJ73_00966 [Blastomyces percursus]|uniref:Myb-like DNA-binding domain-containing protein n=1 Tax=Blastomyces percursus TaxID=1658174 RepID=A0A1J9QGM9_9EURO|nr:hypothetical protein ACJ73_00966 [Blastomyces percursus]